MTKKEKNIIKNQLKEALSQEDEISKIVIFGSFLKANEPNDIDVAIFQNSTEIYLKLAMKYRRLTREIAKIIESEQCGILVDFEDPADIARAIMHLWKNPQICREMGQRAREAFLTRHNWEAEVRPVIDCIKKWKSAAAI